MARNPKAVALILDRLSGEPAGEGAPEEAAEADVGLESAASEVLAAVHSGSPAELAAALEAFVRQCNAGAYPDEE